MGILQRPVNTDSTSSNIYLAKVVDAYGAVGDGVTNDSLAFQATVQAAGVMGAILLTPGKTYLVDRRTTLLSGQIVYANGATVKKRAQIVTTSVQTIAHNATSVVVADVTGFEVGQSIGLYTDATHYTQSNAVITSINVGTKTLDVTGNSFNMLGGLSCVAPSVFLSFDTFKTDEGCHVYGVAINGNRSNWSFYRWELTSEIHAYYGRNTIRDVYIYDAPGEAIQESGLSNYASISNVYEDNVLININGNGIHLSGSEGSRVLNNYIKNTNAQGAFIGHNGGCITVSNGARDYTVSGNRLESGRSGVGEISSIDNSRYNISNNFILNMSTYMIESRGFTANISDLRIVNNLFLNDTAPAAGPLIMVSLEDTGAGETSRLILSSNDFVNAGCYISKARGVTASVNSFNTTYQVNDTFHNAFTLSDVSESNISLNSTKYGNAGITLNGNIVDTQLSMNTIVKPYYYGIYGIGGTNSNLQYLGNIISMDNNVNASAQALTVGDNSCAKNNVIKMTAGHSCIRVNGKANAIVQANTCRTFAANKSIRVETGSTGYVVVDNQVTHAVLDTPLVGVRVANNDIIV